TSIVPAKAKSIAQHDIQGLFLGYIKGKIKPRINLRILVKMINRRWNKVMLHSEDGCNSFDGSRSSKEMSGLGFGRADVELESMIAKYLRYRSEFCHITQW